MLHDGLEAHPSVRAENTHRLYSILCFHIDIACKSLFYGGLICKNKYINIGFNVVVYFRNWLWNKKI